MRFYYGKRFNSGETMVGKVTVLNDSACRGSILEHHMRHSPTGFEWGYGGSGPADLSLAILWDFLGKEPTNTMYMAFKFFFVATWKESWVISEDEINKWIEGIEEKN